MAETLEIDGSAGEGGGQVLRTCLSLSVATGRPVRLSNIRAGRPKPGLMRQHLTCVRAAARISGAYVEGDTIGSRQILFQPAGIFPGQYTFKVGSAGSCLLVLQTVLPPLLRAVGPSQIELEGGTHNPAAPPWEVIERAWFPALRAMGAKVDGRLERHGFMPAGGGRAVVTVTPGTPAPFVPGPRGLTRSRVAEAIFANLHVNIAERELQALGQRLGLSGQERKLREVKSSGPGNVLILTLEHEAGTEVIAEFGMKSRSAETVARMAAKEVEGYMAHPSATIGAHLADQLLVPMVLSAGGQFTTVKPTRHTVTNADIVRAFVPGAVVIEPKDGHHLVKVAALPQNTA